ncbi:MAG: uracil phosphoribosyltransferase [Caldiserica bacterium]|jgi:uracil phosphoribosyltransferase|nr:uracil phosphoribosyltransferase [Caldisericota bacterium]
MKNVLEINHPLIQHKLALLRDKHTEPKEFRELVEELSMLLAYEVFRNLPSMEVEVETPLARTTVRMVNGKKIALFPILRAGLVMANGILRLIPNALVGHLGIYRDSETLSPVPYYYKLPEHLDEKESIVLDPMLATGGSATYAVKVLKEQGARNIKFVCIIAAPEGVNTLFQAHPDVLVYTASVDQYLNSHGYIVPGLGDAGDRLFGTK